jgi:oligopeptidase B
MKTLPRLFQILIVSCFVLSCTMKNVQPPVAEKVSKEIITNGYSRIDNYYWLNDRNNPNVISYLEAENAYTDAVMKDYSKVQDKIFNEIVSKIKQEDMSVPYNLNGYYYYTRYEGGKEYPIYCRKKGSLNAKEEILLNVNELAKGYEYCKVSGYEISPDNKLMAYGMDTISRRLYTLYLKNLETGEISKHSINNTTGTCAWANDNKTIFYTLKDTQTLRASKIYKHCIDPSKKDVLVYEEKDDVFGTTLYKTKTREYLFIVCYSKTSVEYWFLDANKPDGKFKLIQRREKDHEYIVDHYKDKFFIITNWNAKNFRLMSTEIDKPGRENWKEQIGHRPDVSLLEMEIFKNFLVISERKNGLINIRIIDWKTWTNQYLDFGEETYSASIGINPEIESDNLRYNYSSLTTPQSVYDYNLVTHEKVLKKQQEIVGGFDPTLYKAKRVYAKTRDGKMIPISLVYRKGMKKNGNNPLLLYGYGSYGISTEASFALSRLCLLDRGFIYAIAHIRGGQEIGREWYDDGKMLNKKNTFDDFICCAEFLIKQKYTSPKYLFASGGSAGGLLVGAVANMRPDLFKGIIADVPFVDVVTTMLDESIPLTTAEYQEWGNPKDSVYFKYMLSYSPYDNVKAVNYPAMLVIAGLHDSQVQYWEPAKWVAKLRATKTDNNLLLLSTNMKAGHGGMSGRFESYKEYALQYAFMLKILGRKN